MSNSDMSRFMSKVEESPSGCMIWAASKSPQGYGWFSWKSKPVLAHRWVFEARRHPIPPGMVIDHLCRNRACVNPAHLECVSMAENTRRGMLHDLQRAKAKAMTVCKRGHPLFGDNCRVNMAGNRMCKACQRLMADAWKARNRDHINAQQQARRAAGGR